MPFSEGSEGAQACSLGREPQGRPPIPIQEALKGDGNSVASAENAVAPSGLGKFCVSLFLGLTPQATCRRPYGANS